MLSTMKIWLSGDPDRKYGSSLGSLLHGVLMRQMDPQYAERLHQNGAHPFSQFFRAESGRLCWTIHTLNREAAEEILKPLQSDAFQKVVLDHEKDELIVEEKDFEMVSYEDLISQYYFENESRSINLSFLTPVSFKQNGEYSIFPSIRLIFQSLMKKYDAAADRSTIYTEEVLEHYERYASIVKYRLRSTTFRMESIRIPSFMGDLTIRVRGPQQLVNLAWLLMQFGCYSGVGMKTGLGMGAMAIRDRGAGRESALWNS